MKLTISAEYASRKQPEHRSTTILHLPCARRPEIIYRVPVPHSWLMRPCGKQKDPAASRRPWSALVPAAVPWEVRAEYNKNKRKPTYRDPSGVANVDKRQQRLSQTLAYSS